MTEPLRERDIKEAVKEVVDFYSRSMKDDFRRLEEKINRTSEDLERIKNDLSRLVEEMRNAKRTLDDINRK